MNQGTSDVIAQVLTHLGLMVFLIGLQIYVGYMVFGRHIGTRRSPISLIADAAARTVNKNWRRFMEISSASPLDKGTLANALAYLRTARLRAVDRDYEERRRQIEEEHKRTVKEYEYREPSAWRLWLGAALLLLLESLGLTFVVIAVPIALVWAATKFPTAVLGIALFTAVLLVINRYATSGQPRWRPQEAFAYGSGYFVKQAWSRGGTEWSEAETHVLSLMEGLSEQGNFQSGRPADDPDLRKFQEGTELALAPGISELVFSVTDSTIQEIRKNLLGVRRQHRLFTWLSFLSFLSVIGVTVFGIVFRGIRAGPQLLGGGGISFLLATFCFIMLQNLRTSQIALALFASYVAELHEGLAYAERQEEHSRQRLRSKAWQNFRRGINELWLQERASPPLFPKAKQRSH